MVPSLTGTMLIEFLFLTIMWGFNRQTSIEKTIEQQEQRFVIEVGHNRNNELIIKKMRVSGDNIKDVLSDLELALSEFLLMHNVSDKDE